MLDAIELIIKYHISYVFSYFRINIIIISIIKENIKVFTGNGYSNLNRECFLSQILLLLTEKYLISKINVEIIIIKKINITLTPSKLSHPSKF